MFLYKIYYSFHSAVNISSHLDAMLNPEQYWTRKYHSCDTQSNDTVAFCYTCSHSIVHL